MKKMITQLENIVLIHGAANKQHCVVVRDTEPGNPLALVVEGIVGFYPLTLTGKALADSYNKKLVLSEDKVSVMEGKSMFGWS